MHKLNVGKFSPPGPLNTAVLFIVFNRLDTARRVFDSIRRARPPRLYIAADGPRQGCHGEDGRVKAVRNYILSNIDWDCQVYTLFRDKNLGCKIAVSSALDWFFESEEMGIVLEDDCLPGLSFFWFCEELLEKYKSDPRVMHIAGGCYVPSRENSFSYHFVRTGGIWGWASWRRAWKLYELEMESWPRIRDCGALDKIFSGEPEMRRFYGDVFGRAYGNHYTWDYQWAYTRIVHESLNIMPDSNLVVNIGFGKDATHTAAGNKKFSEMRIAEMCFPLVHPPRVERERKFDLDNFRYITAESFAGKMWKKVENSILPKIGSYFKQSCPRIYGVLCNIRKQIRGL